MSVPAVFIKKSTGEILKHAPYPNLDMSPVIGLEPDTEWLLKHTPFVSPDIDRRIYSTVTTHTISTDPHPDYPDFNQYKTTYATVRNTDEEIVAQIQNAETNANEQIVKYSERTKLLSLAIAVLIRRVENLVTTPKEQVVLDKALANGIRIWKNDAEVKLKIQQVVDGLEPEIDANWES